MYSLTMLYNIFYYPYRFWRFLYTIRQIKQPTMEKIASKYIIKYTIANQNYAIIIRPVRGPYNPTIIDQDGNDITKLVQPYLGPSKNFVHNSFKPEDVGVAHFTII